MHFHNQCIIRDWFIRNRVYQKSVYQKSVYQKSVYECLVLASNNWFPRVADEQLQSPVDENNLTFSTQLIKRIGRTRSYAMNQKPGIVRSTNINKINCIVRSAKVQLNAHLQGW